MRKLQAEFLDRMVQVSFTTGAVTGVLEAVEEDGAMLLRQGRSPLWVSPTQVRYVSLLEERIPFDEPEDSLT